MRKKEMRIYLIIVEEPIFHPKIVEEILVAKKKEIVGITIVPDVSPTKSLIDYLFYQWNFFGLKAFIYFPIIEFNSFFNNFDCQWICKLKRNADKPSDQTSLIPEG